MVTSINLPNHLGSAVLPCTLVRKVSSYLAKIIMNFLKSQLILMQKQGNIFVVH